MAATVVQVTSAAQVCSLARELHMPRGGQKKKKGGKFYDMYMRLQFKNKGSRWRLKNNFFGVPWWPRGWGSGAVTAVA